MPKKKAYLTIHSDNEYIRQPKEEFMLCQTSGCNNVIANWATGVSSNGYCSACRLKIT